jgi:hypothetical protein
MDYIARLALATVDSREAEFRAESFNILNHPEFDRPNVNNFGSPTFGQITSTTNKVNGTAGDPNSRIIQLGLRLFRGRPQRHGRIRKLDGRRLPLVPLDAASVLRQRRALAGVALLAKADGQTQG